MGYVSARNANPKRLEVFKRGLAELGYAKGKNIRIDYREAVLDGEYDSVVADLVSRQVDVIPAANVAATRGARPADLPISGPTQFTMSANRMALTKLGLSLPSDLVAQVNEWIE
jgi:putative ABC transport system substrate-binding protein